MSRRAPITISDDEDDASQNFSIGSRRPGPSLASGSGRERRTQGLSVSRHSYPDVATRTLTNRRRSIPRGHGGSKAAQRGRGGPPPGRAERAAHAHPRQLHVRPRRRERGRSGEYRRAGLRAAYLCAGRRLRAVLGGTGGGGRGGAGCGARCACGLPLHEGGAYHQVVCW